MSVRLLMFLSVLAGCHDPGGLPIADLGPDLTPRTSITVASLVLDYRTLAALPGVMVCNYQPDQVTQTACTTTDPKGTFHLSLPANARVLISYQLGTYLPSLLQYTTGGSDAILAAHTIVSGPDAMHFADKLLVPIDPSKPILTVQVDDAAGRRLAGASVAAAFAPGDGPFYFDDAGVPVDGLSATTTSGLAAWINTRPGEVDVSVRYRGQACAGGNAWPGSQPGTFLAKVIGGFSTSVGVSCP